MSESVSQASQLQEQSLPPGTRLEEFVIERILGSGGFGITYLAKDSRLGRQVVIKENLPAQFCWRESSSLMVRPRHSQGEDAESFAWSLENFEKEAAMLASLDHPGIVRVLRSFEAFGTAFFVMPFVEGKPLDEEIRDRRDRGGAFSEEELVGLLRRMLDALEYLHVRGIYHRDIKPGNILISQEGVPVLIDFGSARQRLSERSLTVIESPGYTPFEQLQSRGKIGPWSDLYALGGTLYKAITGETPPKATDRIMEDPMLPLSERPELVERYSRNLLTSIDRAMTPRIDRRMQTAVEWRDWREGLRVQGEPKVGSAVPSMEGERHLGEMKRPLRPKMLSGDANPKAKGAVVNSPSEADLKSFAKGGDLEAARTVEKVGLATTRPINDSYSSLCLGLSALGLGGSGCGLFGPVVCGLGIGAGLLGIRMARKMPEINYETPACRFGIGLGIVGIVSSLLFFFSR